MVADVFSRPETYWILGAFGLILVFVLACIILPNSRKLKLRFGRFISSESDWSLLREYVTLRAQKELGEWLGKVLEIPLSRGRPSHLDEDRYNAFFDLMVMFRYYFDLDVGPEPRTKMRSSVRQAWRRVFFMAFIRYDASPRMFHIGAHGLTLRRPMKSAGLTGGYAITREMLQALGLVDAMRLLFEEKLADADGTPATLSIYVKAEPEHTAVEWLEKL